MGRRPVLIMFDRVSERLKGRGPNTIDLRDKLSPFDFPNIPEDSEFQPRVLMKDGWITLVTRHPSLIQDYMMFPHEPSVMDAMASAATVKGNGRYFDVEPLKLSREPHHWGNITGRSAHDVMRVLKTLPPDVQIRLRALYDPFSSNYLVNWGRQPEAEDLGNAGMIRGAWELSSFNAEEMEVHRLLSDTRVVDGILQGARILYIPGGAILDHPMVVGVSRKGEDDGVEVREVWTPKPGQRERRGSSISLLVTKGVRERLLVGDLVRTLDSVAREVRGIGHKPAVAVDLDGTVFSTRLFAAEIFNEWAEGYDGHRADEIRALVAENEVRECWNNATVLKGLGIDDEEIVAEAMVHFNANFMNPDRRLEMPPIMGMVRLVKILQRMGVRTIYVTARNAEIDTLSNGEASSRTLLKSLGIWDEGSVLLRNDERELHWSVGEFKNGHNEPDKWRMIKGFKSSNGDVYFIAVIDNAPTHVEGYRKYFRYGIYNIHVEGDRPPGSPPLQDGVFSVKPNQLESDIEEWETLSISRGRELANDLSRRLTMMDQSKSSPIYDDDRTRLEKARERDARSAKQILTDVASLGSWDPKHKGFLDFINAMYGHSIAELEEFENGLRAVNRYTNSSFAVLRSTGGIARVVSAKDNETVDDVPVESAPDSIVLPAVDRMIMGPMDASFTASLETIVAGPELASLGVADHYMNLSFANYPRMQAALAAMLGMVRDTGLNILHEIVAVEHSPGISLAAMGVLAASGLDVRWREADSAERIRTERELRRLPDEIRSRIAYLDKDEPVKADIVISNKPYADVSLADVAKDTGFGGVIAVQGRAEPVDLMEEGSKLSLLGSVALYNGDYVLPTACTSSIVSATPLFFHVWQVGAV